MEKGTTAVSRFNTKLKKSIVPVLEIFLPLLIVVILIFTVFFRFKEENRQMVQNKNKEYIQDFTLSIANTLNQKFNDAEIAVEAIAGSIDFDALNSESEHSKILRILENETQFDHVRYVDVTGVSHTSSGIAKDISFRSYYTEGMKGHSGITYITDSVLTNQRQIGFYAPIIRGGKVCGEMVVFYDEATLAESLNYDFYGEKSSVAIIDNQGEVLVNSPSQSLKRLYEQGLPESLYEQAESDMHDETTKAKLRRALENHAATDLEFHVNGSTTVGYLAPLETEGLSVYMIFPYQANIELYEDSVTAGRKLQISLITVFGCFALYLLILGIARIRREKMNNSLAVLIAKADEAVSKGQLIVYPNEDLFENHSRIRMQDEESGNMDRLEGELLRFSEDQKNKEDIRAFVQKIRNGQLTEDFPALDIQWKDRSDIVTYYNLTYVPVEAKAGTVTTGVIQVRDVTAQRKEEYENKRVLERALKNAEIANEAKTAFLFNMSHDIRTPMNAIIGYTELMEQHSGDRERCRNYLTKIRNSGELLLSLINNVLEMARIESGKTTVEEVPCSVLDIGDNINNVFEELMRKKNITFSLTHDFKASFFYIDKVKLNEIYVNLISNAYKYTPEGGSISVDVRELPCREDGLVPVQVTVSDTGIGMSAEFLPHLFESFSRERSSTESRIQGTGLGMPIVKKLVDMMHGTITVESEPGKGTTFVVTIPHRVADAEMIAEGQESVIETGCLTGKRILLAEDNDLNAEIAIEILQEYGMTIDRAEDGAICVDMISKAEAGTYDMILMDIQMPNMDGYKATETIRAMTDKDKAEIPIVAMTANAFAEDKQNAFAVGMNGHLAKPIDIQKMLETLTEILGKGKE